MKPTNAILLSILILFQSCYSYKKVATKTLDINFSKEHTITLSKKKSYRGKITKVTTDSIEIISSSIKYKIPKSTIQKITELTYLPKQTTTLVSILTGILVVFIIISKIPKFEPKFNTTWIM